MASAVSGFFTQFQSDRPMGCYQDLELADDFGSGATTWPRLHRCSSAHPETKRQKPGTRLVDLARGARPRPTTRPSRALKPAGPTWRWPTAFCTALAEGRIQQAFINENVVSGVE